ncbi:MAG: hypothetical protein P8I56_10965, partial [Paracoccaceae bacterium]|nr:hypothetical protein [Paracoccaceae bacterium]
MDDITDPELKAKEERKAHRARRQERQARRKMREKMTSVAVAAAADHARQEEGAIDTAVAETYENATPGRRGDDRVEKAAEADYTAAAAPSKKDPPAQAKRDEPQSVQALARIDSSSIARAPKPGALADTVPVDAFEIARAQREARMKEIRNELRRRRRLRSLSILVRFLIFVIGPTAFVGWYYYEKATDMYVSESALIFKSGSA